MPEGLSDTSEELIINAVTFPQDGVIEINYAEKRDHSDFAGIVKTIYIDIDKIKIADQVDEIVSLTREIVDTALLAIRQPPSRFARGRTTKSANDDDE